MADRKISDLTALTTPAAGDYLPIVDISEVAASSKNKRITIEELLRGAPDGTAAAPSIGFESDPNTGIYSPGADQLAISTNGTGRLFVDASGNVGVGAAPSNTFDVTAASNPTASIRTTAAATSTSILKLEGYRTSGDTGRLGEISVVNTRDGDEQASIEITADGDTEGKFTFKSSTNSLCEFGNSFTRFFSSNTERLRITSAGLVGIGTSSPGAVLHCAINSSATSIATAPGTAFFQNLNATSGAINNLLFVNSGGFGSAAIYTTQTQTGNSGDNLVLNTKSSGGSWNTGVVVDTAGRVGIGTTSPGTKFQVRIATNKNIGFDLSNGEARLSCFDDAVANAAPLVLNGSDCRFEISSNERLRIDSSGRLLVGTSSARSNFFNTNISAGIQLEGLGDTNRLLSVVSNTNDAFSEPNLILGKTRGTSLGSNTVVQSNDPLGSVCFQGADGSEFVEAASIKAFVDGTPGANDMPGRLVFSTTADGASSPTERLRITSAGLVGIGTTSPNAATDIRVASAGASILRLTDTANNQDLLCTMDVNKTIFFTGGSSTSAFAFISGTAGERARIDSSGRLLVGASSTSAGSTFVLQGNTASSGIGIISLANSGSSLVNGEALGVIRFTSNTHNAAAAILAARDAGTWTSGSSEPTRLTFFTTSDASASPTERLRITSAGVLQVADAGNIAVGTTTGTKIGTATTQKLGFFNATPVVQPAAVADATDAATVITQLNDLLAKLRTLGIIAT